MFKSNDYPLTHLMDQYAGHPRMVALKACCMRMNRMMAEANAYHTEAPMAESTYPLLLRTQLEAVRHTVREGAAEDVIVEENFLEALIWASRSLYGEAVRAYTEGHDYFGGGGYMEYHRGVFIFNEEHFFGDAPVSDDPMEQLSIKIATLVAIDAWLSMTIEA